MSEENNDNKNQVNQDNFTFTPLNADQDVDRVTVVESLCEHCGKNGITKLLLIQIPYFREIVIMAFECPHCYFKENQLQSASTLAEKAVTYFLKVRVEKKWSETAQEWSVTNEEAIHRDMNRQIVKSDTAVIKIPEIQLEIPASRRGEITTVEGVLSVAADNLSLEQDQRRAISPETADKIQQVIDQLRNFAQGKDDFTLVVEDLSGNSFIQNPAAPNPDPGFLLVLHRERTAGDLMTLGYSDGTEISGSSAPGTKAGGMIDKTGSFQVSEEAKQRLDTYFNVTDRAASVPGACPNCLREAETRMCVTDIPYFKEAILMVTDCSYCGFRDSEVKPGGGVSDLGRKVTLRAKSEQDLKRDLLKSDSATLEVVELELTLAEGTLGGKYTTVEGILNDIKTQLSLSTAFSLGDSANDEDRAKIAAFFKKLDHIISGSLPFTLVLDDPLGNVFIQKLSDQDDQLDIVDYERTAEQNETYGFSLMKTENYAAPDTEEKQQ